MFIVDGACCAGFVPVHIVESWETSLVQYLVPVRNNDKWTPYLVILLLVQCTMIQLSTVSLFDTRYGDELQLVGVALVKLGLTIFSLPVTFCIL
jgi:hypothetical protein